MSVVVIGVDLPEDCDSCWLPGKDCNLWLQTDVGERHKDCPLRPLPEKHGRLIDADEIEKLVAGYQEQADMHSARAKELCGDSDTVSKFTWAYSQAAIYKRVINDLDTVLSSVPTIVEAEGD